MRQRRFAIAQSYADNNDAATLARDPALKIMAGKAPESAADLASGYPYRDLLALVLQNLRARTPLILFGGQHRG